MDDAALSETVGSELPFQKRNRRMRLTLRFTALVLGVSALGAVYWFTRPPELVWWRSPVIGDGGRRLFALIPNGWGLDLYGVGEQVSNNGLQRWYVFSPIDRRPGILRRILPHSQEIADLTFNVGYWKADVVKRSDPRIDGHGPVLEEANRFVLFSDKRTWAEVSYSRNYVPAFDRTYRQICNSLRIE
jgi:hypothetical protein